MINLKLQHQQNRTDTDKAKSLKPSKRNNNNHVLPQKEKKM